MRLRIFLARYQHGDHPASVNVGNRVSWPLALSDGELLGWPRELLDEAQLEAASTPGCPDSRVRETIVSMEGGIRARWDGAGPVPAGVKIAALVSVDYLKPPFVESSGTVVELAVLSQVMHVDGSGRFTPSWQEWRLRAVDVVPTIFQGLPGNGDGRIETGVIATVELDR